MKTVQKRYRVLICRALAACLLFAANVALCEAEKAEYVFAKTQYGYVLVEYNGDEAWPVMPAGVDDGPVIAVGNSAFAGNDAVEQIYFPPSITAIGANAFAGCDALECVMLARTMGYIGENAFAGCDSAQIYCEAGEEMAAGWHEDWNAGGLPVHWNSAQGENGPGAEAGASSDAESAGGGLADGERSVAPAADLEETAAAVSLVPIPVLAPDTVDIPFDMEVKEASPSPQAAAGPDGSGAWFVSAKGTAEGEAAASASEGDASDSVQIIYDAPPPAGMETLLDLLAQAAGPAAPSSDD